ncbi:MAG: phosphate signaling complex protein PhoU [Actinobacteria bacterium]|nr:phosphate signaling complex protein PhoU [Actinomycetota bacterium]
METRKSFHENIDDLYLELLKMSGTVLEMIERTRVAFSDMDGQLFQEVIDSDDIVDDYLVRIEREGVEIIARHAPVAIDLRMIIVIMRIAQTLERTADNCVNINKALFNLEGYVISHWIKENIDEMFQRSINMLIIAMDAFKGREPEKACTLSLMDNTVDRINRNFLTRYDHESEDETELVVRVVMISRFLERIADHAVDIGEYVKYMVTGELDNGDIGGT